MRRLQRTVVLGQERVTPCTVASILFMRKVSQTIGGMRNILGSNINITSGKWEDESSRVGLRKGNHDSST